MNFVQNSGATPKNPTPTNAHILNATQQQRHTPTHLFPLPLPPSRRDIRWIKRRTKQNAKQRPKLSLTKQQYAALTNLANNPDKMSSIVIQNRWDYIKHNEDHLNDPLTYTRLESDPTEHLCHQINLVLNQLKSEGFACTISVNYHPSWKPSRPLWE